MSSQSILVDPEKMKVVLEWPQPTNVVEIRSCVGLVGYYQRFVEGFSYLAALMTKLIQKNMKFV